MNSPTDHERLLARGVHLASILAPITAPVVGYAIGKSTPFVRAHAIDCGLDVLRWKGFLFLLRGWLAYVSIMRLLEITREGESIDVGETIKRALIGFVLLLVLEILNVVQAVIASNRARRGEWPPRGWVQRKFKTPYPEG